MRVMSGRQNAVARILGTNWMQADGREVYIIIDGERIPFRPEKPNELDTTGMNMRAESDCIAWVVADIPIGPYSTALICVRTQMTTCLTPMPQGLVSSPHVLARLGSPVVGELIGRIMFIYADDIAICGRRICDHAQDVSTVFTAMRKYNLKVKPTKCEWARTRMKILGFVVSKDRITADPAKCKAIALFPTPTSARADALPTRPPTLALLWLGWPIGTWIDASQLGLGLVAQQRGDDSQVHPIEFASRTLSKLEGADSAMEFEALAVVRALKKLHYYCLGVKATVYTGHSALQ
uniref:Reverse transcriptase domain-containing protein n=1 Tax=Plectus sambesii TaxID=2011161 RepID=A0A914X922_9BILA